MIDVMTKEIAADLLKFKAILANDAYAITFQSFGQYRSALLKELDAIIKRHSIKCEMCGNYFIGDTGGYIPLCDKCSAITRERRESIMRLFGWTP